MIISCKQVPVLGHTGVSSISCTPAEKSNRTRHGVRHHGSDTRETPMTEKGKIHYLFEHTDSIDCGALLYFGVLSLWKTLLTCNSRVRRIRAETTK